MRRIARSSACLCLSGLAACASSPDLPVNGCEWLDPPPRLELCEPGQDPHVDGNLIAECTALTGSVGEWLLGLVAQGRANCPEGGW